MSIKEFHFSAAFAVLGTVANSFLGGWDVILQLLIMCMVVDYATGLLGAIRTKTVNSEVMFWGGVRKGVLFLVIAMAVMLDQLVGNQSPVFRTLTLYFFIGREGLSIVENLGVLGVPMPAFFKKILEQLKEKGDATP